MNCIYYTNGLNTIIRWTLVILLFHIICINIFPWIFLLRSLYTVYDGHTDFEFTLLSAVYRLYIYYIVIKNVYTYSLFFLPRFHSTLVFLELVAPVRVHPMVVQRSSGRRTPVCIHRQVKCAQQGAGQLTVVPAAVLFGRTDDHHAAFNGGNIFFHSAVTKK